MYLLQGNCDEYVVTLESNMAAFSPNSREAEVVTEDFDEILSVNRSQPRQEANLALSLSRHSRYLLGRLFSENREVQIEGFLEVPSGFSKRLAY